MSQTAPAIVLETLIRRWMDQALIVDTQLQNPLLSPYGRNILAAEARVLRRCAEDLRNTIGGLA